MGNSHEDAGNNFENNPLLPLLELESRVVDYTKMLKELVDIYNSFVDSYNKLTPLTKALVEENVKKELSQVNDNIERVKEILETSKKELEGLTEKMKSQN